MIMSNFLLFLLLQILYLCVAEAGYNDTIRCEEFPEVANLTVEDIREETFGQGSCVPFSAETDRTNPCSRFFTPGEDYYFLPSGRQSFYLDNFAEDAALVLSILGPECQDAGVRAVCYYYYAPCGNSTDFSPPQALCRDVCEKLTTDICADEWQFTLEYTTQISDFLNRVQLQFVTCNDTDLHLGSIPHCCSDAGITFVTATTTPEVTTESLATFPSPADQDSVVIVAASVSGGLAVLLILMCVVTVMLCVLWRKNREKSNRKEASKLPEVIVSPPPTPGVARYVPTATSTSAPVVAGNPISLSLQPRARVNSAYIRNMSELKLLIPGRHIQLQDTVGQGEFGVVYRGHLTGWEGRTTAELVAVKTLKSFYSIKDVEDLLNESEKMQKFQHPNVLNLIGVCIDAGEAPYIVMPFMANGSLLTYLRKERHHLTIATEAGEEPVADAQRKLLSICLQIAKGMCYLAQQKFVHRDLAARNCMIDNNFVIKVADFGLSEDIYCRNYFKQGQVSEEGATVKLPVRWMALESLLDSIFTEKTDVWSYGVTCWEVFSLGHTPYPAVDPFALVKFLRDGNRLDKPSNAACTQQVYELIGLCWTESPDKRPSFQELVERVNSLLEGVAGYLDFSAFSGESLTGQSYDHLEVLKTNLGYDHLEKKTSSYDHLAEKLKN